jgi:hypothetical protein
MRRFNSLIVLGLLLAAMPAVQAQQTGDLERIAAASQQFVVALPKKKFTSRERSSLKLGFVE